ncbi:MAG: alpha-isopropylmalate synthase regulatory domain-containing protein, partial [Mycobacteriales bacterium]
LMKTEHQLDLPRRLQIEFSGVVQQHTDADGGEVGPKQLWRIFSAEYLAQSRLSLQGYRSVAPEGDETDRVEVDLAQDGAITSLTGGGNGPVAAFVAALRGAWIEVSVLDYAEHALSAGGDASAAAYTECKVGDEVRWGVGVDTNIVTASFKAVVCAVNRKAGAAATRASRAGS